MDAGHLKVRILGLALLMVCAPLGAQQTEVCPTFPGTNVRDYSKPCIKVEGNRGYRTLPGTSVQDYSKPGVVMENGLTCPTLPGTSVRDYSKSCIKVEGSPIVPVLPDPPSNRPPAPSCRSDYCIQGSVIYPVLPGTQTRDYTRPGALVVGRMLCPTLSGTDLSRMLKKSPFA